jgi:phosphoserine aminotransferase
MKEKPAVKPNVPNFSSGPCAKHPNWNLQALQGYAAGRSHRSDVGKKKLKEAGQRVRELLNVPEDYRIGIFAGSDTGAFECAMWSLLGPKAVDVFVWESFSKDWATDVTKQLKLKANVYDAPYGQIPDLGKADWNNDVVFVWNGTTSGVKIPNGDWIADDRQGLAVCDATSALFAMDIPWKKIDVLTFSWQKCLGGEGGHGMMILSPRAVERLESYTPAWPMPKIFRMKKADGKINEDIFNGSPINTPSMLCVEDWIDTLEWAKQQGGLPALMKLSNDNLAAVEKWVAGESRFGFLAEDKKIRSNTSVCLKVVDSKFTSLSADDQKATAKKIEKLLAAEGVAYDINAYKAAPTGFRLWCGPTVVKADLELCLEWLIWAYEQAVA